MLDERIGLLQRASPNDPVCLLQTAHHAEKPLIMLSLAYNLRQALMVEFNVFGQIDCEAADFKVHPNYSSHLLPCGSPRPALLPPC